MAEKRKGKKRKDELAAEGPEKPSKEEYAVAKWLRKNVPTKKTKFLNHNVEYFTAAKAVDALLASQWAASKNGDEPLFPNRIEVVKFMDTMLRHKLFHRAQKVPVSEQELKAKLKKKDKNRKKLEAGGEKGEDAESSHAEGEKPSGSVEEKEKRKRKIRLEMHHEQLFVDGLDAYVWIYDPVPVYYWFFGTLLVLGAIAICLFPLWPPSVRKGVYYLSIVAVGFLIFIIALAVLRLIVFCLLWLITCGKHHLWLLPNLTEDVGFMASFWPLYQYEYKGGEPEKKSKKKKDKDSDNEEEKQEEDENKEDETKTETEELSTPPDINEGELEKERDNSENESESSQKSQTGKDFEMVEKEEVES